MVVCHMVVKFLGTLAFLGPAYEGGGHLLSLAAFPSTKYTQSVLIRAESTQKRPFWRLTILVPMRFELTTSGSVVSLAY